MTEQLLQLTEEDKKAIVKITDTGDVRELGKVISILMRAMDGQDVSGDDKITMLTNPRNILERSRYPTYTQLSLVVYLELLYTQSGCKAYHEWAQKLSEALISYKGQGRNEYVEMNKSQTLMPQMFPISQPSQQQTPVQAKQHWWNRPKPIDQTPKESTETIV